jgi:hypothetical protein
MGATEPTQPTGSNQSTVATRPKRSARSRVIVVLIALVLVAGGGYGGYRYVLSRPVKVDTDHLSVDVPRSWLQKAVDPGKSLVVSTNTSTWQTSSDTEGVFVGLVASSTLPPSPTAPEGCTAGPGVTGETGNQPTITFQYSCGAHPAVVEQYRQVSDTTQLRIQVRGDTKERQAVLDSAAYTP